MKSISAPVVTGILRLTDFLLLLAGGWFASRLAVLMAGQYPGRAPLLLVTLVGAAVCCASLASAKAYTLERLRSVPLQIRLALKPLIVATGSLIACLFLLNAESFALRVWPFAWAMIGAVLLLVSRCGLSALIRRWIATGQFSRKTAIVGVNDFSREFIERLRDEDGFKIVGVFDDRQSRVPPVHAGIEVRGTVADLLARSREENIDVIVVALPLSAVDRIAHILEQLASMVGDVCLTTDLAGLKYSGHQFGGVGANPIISIKESPMKDWRAAKKACFDLTVAALALVLLSPVLALVALAIRLDSNGPILFRQPRLGFNNRMFLCYKFRSMHQDMTDLMADRQTTRDDPRVTRVGKWIRKLSLDELPQLLNVLNGTMSLVGPRPHAPNTKAADRLFTDVVRQYAVRHRVKPGITGWAQVNGWRGETRTVEEIENRVKCDLFYIDNWSLGFDMKIMIVTVLREIGSRHAF